MLGTTAAAAEAAAAAAADGDDGTGTAEVVSGRSCAGGEGSTVLC